MLPEQTMQKFDRNLFQKHSGQVNHCSHALTVRFGQDGWLTAMHDQIEAFDMTIFSRSHAYSVGSRELMCCKRGSFGGPRDRKGEPLMVPVTAPSGIDAVKPEA